MERARTWSVLPVAVVLIAACTAGATAEEDEPGNSRWPIKTTISATADLKHPRDVPLASLLELGTVPGVKSTERRYQAQRIPAEAFGNPLGLKEGDIVRTTGWLHVVARKPDGDYHVQIAVSQASQAQCLIVEVPNPDPRFKVPPSLQPVVAAVRAEIDEHLEALADHLFDRGEDVAVLAEIHEHLEGATITGQQRVHKLKTPVHVTVTGQLFYDAAHVRGNGSIENRGDHGCRSPTLWELHPLTAIGF